MANVFYLCCYLVKDILWLRVLSVVGGLVLLGYYATSPMPLWAAGAWIGLFSAINLLQIELLLRERRPVTLRPDELRLYQLAFRRLTEREYAKLLAIGQWKEVGPGERIVKRGQSPHQLIVLTDGRARVEVDGRPLAELHPGCFLGELSFVTGDAPNADVVALEPTRTVSWQDDALRKLFATDAQFRASVQQLIDEDLIAKLERTQ
jgi:CRP-like cAMP-binding protein